MKVRVERGNVVLYVEDYEVQYYLNNGYNVTDDFGNIIQATIPNDIGTLQKFYLEHTKKIAELESKIEELTKKPEPVKKEPAKKKPTTAKANKETK